MRDAYLDLLDSLEDLGRSSSLELSEHTGRPIKACRYRLPELADLGHARRAGRVRRRRPGRPPILWEITPSGVVALVEERRARRLELAR